MRKASELAARTPASRDRYVDFLRVFSLGTVIVGHWLMAVLLVDDNGAITAGNVLAIMPSLQPLTWVFQVMPLFFLVGGFSHAVALREGGTYADFIRSRAARLLIPTAVFGAVWLVAVVALTAYGPYSISMVGMPGEKVSNMSPPTLALLAHAAWLTGLAMLLRGPVTRLLARTRVWTAVIAANGLAMTAFLWHLTAQFLVAAAQLAFGLAQPPVGGAAWWLLRPVWLGLLALVTAGLIAVFRGADQPRSLPARSYGTARAVAGVTLCLVGVLGFSAVGFGGALAGRTAYLIVLPVTPIGSAALLAAGAGLLGLGGSRVRLLRDPK